MRHLEPEEWIALRLPPKPDPLTGEPRPPATPLRHGGPRSEPESDVRRRPPPPAGEGPVLEWFELSRRSFVKGIAAIVVFGAILGSVAEAGLDWMTEIGSAGPYWGFTAFLIVLFVGSNRARVVTAGAEWLRTGRRRYVRTYELVRLVVKLDRGSRYLTLTDLKGHVAHMDLGTIQENPRLWDLVYNGILHSVHLRPVEADRETRAALDLPAYPAWKRAQDTRGG